MCCSLFGMLSPKRTRRSPPSDQSVAQAAAGGSTSNATGADASSLSAFPKGQQGAPANWKHNDHDRMFDSVGPPPAAAARQPHAKSHDPDCMDRELLTAWFDNQAAANGSALPEYQAARDLICLSHTLMGTSTLTRQLAYLDTKIQQHRHLDFATVVCECITKAWALSSKEKARTFNTAGPGDLAGRGHPLGAAMNVHGALASWQRPYLTHALALLNAKEDATGLQVVLGLLMRGSAECEARKAYAFNTIVSRVELPGVGQVDLGTPAASPSVPQPVQLAARQARQVVLEHAVQIVGDTKDRAFKTTFLEPAKMAFRCMGDTVMEGDVDVHGANTYLAVLAATLGVALNRQPHLTDGIAGVADFLPRLDAKLLDALWCPSMAAEGRYRKVLGLNWEAVQPRLEPMLTPARLKGYSRDHAGVAFAGACPRDVALSATDPSSKSKKQRKGVAPYLQHFAGWFTADLVVPHLVANLVADDRSRRALGILAADLRNGQPVPQEEEDDVCYWLYDGLEGTLRFDRAVLLLQHAGILRHDLASAQR